MKDKQIKVMVIALVLMTMLWLGFRTGMIMLEIDVEDMPEKEASSLEEIKDMCPDGIGEVVFDDGYGNPRPIDSFTCK